MSNKQTAVTFSVNVTAASVEEACNKVKQGGYAKTISSVGVYNIPVFTTDKLLDSNKSPDFLFDVTPSLLNCNTCCDFLIDEDVEDDAGAFTEGVDLDSWTYNVSGVMNLSGKFNGQPLYHFVYPLNGLMVIGSNTKIAGSVFRYNGSIGMNLGGNFHAACSHYGYPLSGTMVIGSLTQLGFTYGMTGSMRIGGSFKAGLSYNGSGTMFLNGNFHPISSAYKYRGSGVNIISSGTSYLCSNVAVTSDSGTIGEVTDLGVTFSVTQAPALIPVVTGVITPCCVVAIPNLLELRHNLLNLNLLSKFLKRNGLTFSGQIGDTNNTFLSLQYRPKLSLWQTTSHLQGLSVTSNGNETWDISFDFSCTNEVGGSKLGQNNWVFTMILRRQSDTTARSRLVIVFAPSKVCSQSTPFTKFIFNFNPKTRATTPANIEVIFHDDAGLFSSSPLFINKPNLQFQISVPSNPHNQTFGWSLEEQRHAASHVADNSGNPL